MYCLNIWYPSVDCTIYSVSVIFPLIRTCQFSYLRQTRQMAHDNIQCIGYICGNWSKTSFQCLLKCEQADLCAPFYRHLKYPIFTFPGQSDLKFNLRRNKTKEHNNQPITTKFTYFMLGKCRMTTSKAWMASKGISRDWPSMASSRANRQTWATHFIATLNTLSLPSPGSVTSISTYSVLDILCQCSTASQISLYPRKLHFSISTLQMQEDFAVFTCQSWRHFLKYMYILINTAKPI